MATTPARWYKMGRVNSCMNWDIYHTVTGMAGMECLSDLPEDTKSTTSQ